MKKRVKRMIIIVILCLISGILSYFGTLFLDKLKKGGDVQVSVTFDDTETYEIPSVQKMDKDTALKEWPYIITLENSGTSKGLYQIMIEDEEKSTIKRDDLEYVLFLDDKEVANGNLGKIKDNLLYTYEIEGKKEQKYKLYIWVINDVEDDSIYTYHLNFNVIKTGGPGF